MKRENSIDVTTPTREKLVETNENLTVKSLDAEQMLDKNRKDSFEGFKIHPFEENELDVVEIDQQQQMIRLILKEHGMPDCGNLRSNERRDIRQRINCLNTLMRVVKIKREMKNMNNFTHPGIIRKEQPLILDTTVPGERFQKIEETVKRTQATIIKRREQVDDLKSQIVGLKEQLAMTEQAQRISGDCLINLAKRLGKTVELSDLLTNIENIDALNRQLLQSVKANESTFELTQVQINSLELCREGTADFNSPSKEERKDVSTQTASAKPPMTPERSSTGRRSRKVRTSSRQSICEPCKIANQQASDESVVVMSCQSIELRVAPTSDMVNQQSESTAKADHSFKIDKPEGQFSFRNVSSGVVDSRAYDIQDTETDEGIEAVKHNYPTSKLVPKQKVNYLGKKENCFQRFDALKRYLSARRQSQPELK